MGNTRSQSFDEPSVDLWWNTRSLPQTTAGVTNEPVSLKLNKTVMSTSSSEPAKQTDASEQRNDDKLDEFRQDLARKHERRRQILAEKRKEMQDLRMELSQQKEENEKLRNALNKNNGSDYNAEYEMHIEKLKQENDEMRKKVVELRTELLRSETISEKNNELRSSIAELQKELQSVNAEVVNFEKERMDYQTHVTALKDVVRVSKEMLKIRESQLNELRQKVSEIESSLAGREMNVLSDDLRQEYERQLRNIRNLRTLYEERQRADKRQKEELSSQLDDAKRDLEAANNKTSELETRINELETDNSQKYDKIKSLESNLGLTKAECRDLQAEMSVINQLFSHILLGFNNCQDIDLDKLIKLLEENHDLLQNIVINEESNAASALPKILLDLVSQINESEKGSVSKESEDVNKNSAKPTTHMETIAEDNESEETQTLTQHCLNSAEQIVENLPKVWKVLIELLSHQSAPPVNVLTETETQSQESQNPCYKVVQTAEGPKLVLSVSQTFIRLKNLILEKKSLEKETTHLKQLNTHLEVRLQDQEKRLELVSNELSKTWHVVGKMQKQHQQLHTQEKILRYELAQKRKLLTELKEELEYCREKWLQAREKNTSTEMQWKQLRTEFASRKTVVHDDLNNSVESGYSDERECSTSEDEEPGYETDVSESNQKVSSPETTSEIMEEASEIAVSNNNEILGLQESEQDTSTILNVIRSEITEIEGKEGKNDPAQCYSGFTERVTEGTTQLLEEAASSKQTLLHSQLHHEKTDFVQNNENGDKSNVSAYVETVASTSVVVGEHSGAENLCNRLSNTENEGNTRQTHCSNSEEILSAKDLRLKRLEEQTKELMNKVASTSNKSIEIDAKLTNLHEIYGESSQSTSSQISETVNKTGNSVDENHEA